MISDFVPMYAMLQNLSNKFVSFREKISFTDKSTRLQTVLTCFYVFTLAPLLPNLFSSHVSLLFTFHISNQIIRPRVDTPSYLWMIIIVCMCIHYEFAKCVSPFYLGCYTGFIASTIQNDKWDEFYIEMQKIISCTINKQ